MPEQLALEKTQEKALEPMQMIQRALEAAIEGGKGLEVVDRILAQQREMMEYQDRLAFNAALRRIQDDLKPIVKDQENRETHSRYASADKVDEAIERLLERERMTLSFRPGTSDKAEMVLIIGVLSLGAYSREYPLEMPADGRGAKGGGVMSRTHATGSAITYGKRYLKNMIFNLRFKERDDDGNLAGKQGGRIDDRAQIDHLENIRNAANKAELQRLYLMALKAAEDAGDSASIRLFIKTKDERLKQL